MPVKPKLHSEVTELLDSLQHPLRNEIETIRSAILTSSAKLQENLKWNGPNYASGEEDRITMRVQPPKKIQLIFHRGAKKLAQPAKKLIEVNSPFWVWKENDRAVVTIANNKEAGEVIPLLSIWVKAWLKAADIRSSG